MAMCNLAKTPTKQVFADLGRGDHAESGTVLRRANMNEHFEKFKMAAKRTKDI